MSGLLCPGQGSQFVGMGKDLADQFPLARQTFEEADEVLGFALSKLCWEGPEDELTLTSNAQPAILVHSTAVWRILEAERPLAPTLGAGHSLGEFSAYVAAGTFQFAQAVAIVRRRGELMLESGEKRPGTMAAVLGLDDDLAESVCQQASREADGVVVPANYNSPGQLVISGDGPAVQRAAELASDAGAKKVVPLNVSGAFHSPLMEVAAPGLQAALDAVNLDDPAFPVVSNVSASPVTTATEARRLLVDQLTSPVRWTASIRCMAGEGVTEFVEIGPGRVLSGLLKRIDRGLVSTTLGTAADLTAYLQGG